MEKISKWEKSWQLSEVLLLLKWLKPNQTQNKTMIFLPSEKKDNKCYWKIKYNPSYLCCPSMAMDP